MLVIVSETSYDCACKQAAFLSEGAHNSLDLYHESLCFQLYSVFAALFTTCAVGPPAVNVVIGLPLLSNLVGVNEYDQHCNQTDERHQHCRTKGCVDVWDEAPKGGRQKT